DHRHTYRVAILGPGTVVVAHLVSEDLAQGEPGVAGTLAATAVGNDRFGTIDPDAGIQLTQSINPPGGTVPGHRLAPWTGPRPRRHTADAVHQPTRRYRPRPPQSSRARSPHPECVRHVPPAPAPLRERTPDRCIRPRNGYRSVSPAAAPRLPQPHRPGGHAAPRYARPA